MQKKPYYLLGISFVILAITSFVKIYMNLLNDSKNGEIVLELFGFPTALTIFSLVNLIIIFITACGTSIFLHVVNLNVKLKSSLIKTKIYLVYFWGYAFINLLQILYTMVTKKIINIFQLNLISLLLFIVVSIYIYKIEYDVKGKKVALGVTSTIFILNSFVPLLSVFQHIL
ncbi:MAG: hypothetical protein ACE3JN_08945 [Ectobacillus sp.]